MKGTGLYPVDRNVVLERIADFEPDNNPNDQNGNQHTGNEQSPRKILIREIAKSINPQISPAMQSAAENQKSTRKRVQAKTGEILTEPEAAECLRKEEEARKEKSQTKKTRPPAKAKAPKKTPKSKPAKKPRRALFDNQLQPQTSGQALVDNQPQTEASSSGSLAVQLPGLFQCFIYTGHYFLALISFHVCLMLV